MKFPCIRCTKALQKIHKGVECSLCNLWVHLECEPDIDEILYGYLCKQSKAGANVNWNCSSCSKSAAKLDMAVKDLARRMETMEMNREASDKRLDTVEAAAVEDKKVSMSSELRDRDSRRLNIVIHGLNEPPTL